MTEAVKWFRNAAEQGHADAQFMLGRCYSTGEGIESNQEEAKKWYEKSAEQGNAEAQYWFGNFCDGEEAVKWYRKAAGQGNAEAEYALARCYRDGNGVEKDENTAMGWLRSAARHGHRFAK